MIGTKYLFVVIYFIKLFEFVVQETPCKHPEHRLRIHAGITNESQKNKRNESHQISQHNDSNVDFDIVHVPVDQVTFVESNKEHHSQPQSQLHPQPQHNQQYQVSASSSVQVLANDQLHESTIQRQVRLGVTLKDWVRKVITKRTFLKNFLGHLSSLMACKCTGSTVKCTGSSWSWGMFLYVQDKENIPCGSKD